MSVRGAVRRVESRWGCSMIAHCRTMPYTMTMPLTPMTERFMGIQSLVSLVTIGLIVSRAVNIL